MQLRSQVEWAIHCCALLAGMPPDRYLSTRVLAEFHGIPKEYLSKALQALSAASLVESTLGPSGGYRLARSPHSITFLDIVEAVEGKGPSFACTEIRRNNPCRRQESCPARERPCPIARVMGEADRAWRGHLRGVTLAELGESLQAEVEPQLLEDSMTWLLERS